MGVVRCRPAVLAGIEPCCCPQIRRGWDVAVGVAGAARRRGGRRRLGRREPIRGSRLAVWASAWSSRGLPPPLQPHRAGPRLLRRGNRPRAPRQSNLCNSVTQVGPALGRIVLATCPNRLCPPGRGFRRPAGFGRAGTTWARTPISAGVRSSAAVCRGLLFVSTAGLGQMPANLSFASALGDLGASPSHRGPRFQAKLTLERTRSATNVPKGFALAVEGTSQR